MIQDISLNHNHKDRKTVVQNNLWIMERTKRKANEKQKHLNKYQVDIQSQINH